MYSTSSLTYLIIPLYLIIPVLVHLVPGHAMTVAPTPSDRRAAPTPPVRLEEVIRSPHVGYVAADSWDAFVVGTSHFRCDSAREVASLIEHVRPDGVVLELDPERVLRLTKQYSGFDENGGRGGERARAPGDLLYGADFMAAVKACQELDIPMFLGDEYAQETGRRLARRFLSWRAYSPAPLARAFVASATGDGCRRKVGLDILESFVKDPRKLLPILVTSSPPFLLASALAFFDNGAMAHDGSTTSNTATTIVTIVISLLASILLFNTVIVDRDAILAASTERALHTVRSLADNESIRKRWQFTVAKQENQPAGSGIISDSLPLFTLKRPLVKDAVRNLNLFEPRWLKMIDEVTRDKAPLEDKIFGCVRCTNKFYSAIAVNGEEGRYADIIFEKVGRLAKIKGVKEGTRPVSGDRKIGVSIEGGDPFIVDESRLSVSSDGYMVATNVTIGNTNSALSNEETCRKSVRMVVVVGLLHGNGVVDLLSKV